MNVLLETLEKENHAQLADFKKLISEKVQQGKLLSVFQLLMKMTRDLAEEDGEESGSEFIDDLINLLKDVCSSVLRCRNCSTVFRFRHCKNPRNHQNDEVHAIELTCEGCGDHYTFAEGRERVSYFNFNVLKKVDNLRRGGRGLTIKVTLGGLVGPALLKVNDGERPVVWIDAYQVFKVEEVQVYWERAKAIIKRMKLNTSNGDKCFRIDDGIVYLLTTQTEVVAKDAV
ncbi:hypothetical protein [Paenibacillus chitinolyticus]